MEVSTQISQMSLACQSRASLTPSLLGRRMGREVRELLTHSRHVASSAKPRSSPTKPRSSQLRGHAPCVSQQRAQCRAMGSCRPRWQQPSLLPTPTLHSRAPSFAMQALTSRALGPVLRPPPRAGEPCSEVSSHVPLPVPSHHTNHTIPRALVPLPGLELHAHRQDQLLVGPSEPCICQQGGRGP